MWKLLQISVVVAVVFSNIHWQWTPNGYVAALLGTVAAFLVTAALSGIIAKRAK